MNESDIRKYAKLMQELGLTGLEIDEKNSTVRLERMPGTVVNTLSPVQMPSSPAPAESKKPASDGSAVTSPMVGIFYAAPAENAEPFVKVGDRVKKGDTLCIIEAMKLMNEIIAEKDAVILEICVKNGQAVEYGSTLFKLGD